jgi:hypothetical protein
MDAFKNRRLTTFAVLLVLYTAQETHGISAYLKQIGPSSLRFSDANPVPASFTLPEILVERLSHTNAPENAISTTTSADTNSVSSTPFVGPLPLAQPTVLTTEPSANPAPTPSASDLLPVSPQMLTEYFKPVADGTNAASVVVPVPVMPVGFTPPVARPSSRATYSTP